MDFNKALEISGKFQESYDTLRKQEGDSLEEKAKPYIGFILKVMERDNCGPCEACLILLKNWHKAATIPTTALTLWLLASAVIIEQQELKDNPLFQKAKELTELEICNRVVRLGDYIKAEYTTGKRFKGGQIKGLITKLWDVSNGDNVKQVQLNNGWCFHEGDKIIEHKPKGEK